MPVASSTITGFGFLGLQTKSVNTFPSAVTTALFDN
jgi:hypothetical protein